VDEDLRNLVGKTAEWAAENNRLNGEMQALKERIQRLKAAEGADCPLCGQPLTSDDRTKLVIELEAEGKTMGDRFRMNRKQMQEGENQRQQLELERTRLNPAEEDLRQATRQLDRWETERARIQAVLEQWQASGAAQLENVEREIAQGEYAHEAQAELARIDRELKQLGYDAVAHDAVRRAEQQGKTAEEQMRQLEAARALLAPLERQVEELARDLEKETARLREKEAEFHQADAEFRASSQGLPDANTVERELNALLSAENNLRTQIGMQQQSIHVLAALRERQGKLAGRREELTRLIGRLKVLERAFSKDGVPALLIEQALPEIENQANELLDRLSAGTMSVSFQTQRDFKDKNRDDKKETLDILIRDASGSAREYEMFSGGEAFRVNFAIRLALSRVLAQRAGARLQMLVIDEGFGSQDADGRQRLIEAINLVKPEFARILVITHLEELKDAFPSRIEVEKTLAGSRVRVVA
jgi:exonuclease SbcC